MQSESNEKHAHSQKKMEMQATEEAQIAVKAFAENISVTLAPINYHKN